MGSAKVCSVGTNPKSLNFEHSNFGLSELLTSQTYPKKCKSKSNFRPELNELSNTQKTLNFELELKFVPTTLV